MRFVFFSFPSSLLVVCTPRVRPSLVRFILLRALGHLSLVFSPCRSSNRARFLTVIATGGSIVELSPSGAALAVANGAVIVLYNASNVRAGVCRRSSYLRVRGSVTLGATHRMHVCVCASVCCACSLCTGLSERARLDLNTDTCASPSPAFSVSRCCVCVRACVRVYVVVDLMIYLPNENVRISVSLHS